MCCAAHPVSATRLESALVFSAALALASGVTACNGTDESPSPPPRSAQETGATEIHLPLKLTSVPSGDVDALGQEIRVSCESCHSQLPEARIIATAMTDLKEFHRGLEFNHGKLECAACHAPTAERRLRLATGKTIPMTEAMQLCGQCHGPQQRDYDAGAHGGMNGSWDLSRGSRVRNHCVDCHDPHRPAYPKVMPAPPPSDVAQRTVPGQHVKLEGPSVALEPTAVPAAGRLD